MHFYMNYARAFQQFLFTQGKIKDISHFLCFYWDLRVCDVPQCYCSSHTFSGFIIHVFLTSDPV